MYNNCWVKAQNEIRPSEQRSCTDIQRFLNTRNIIGTATRESGIFVNWRSSINRTLVNAMLMYYVIGCVLSVCVQQGYLLKLPGGLKQGK